MVDERKNVAQSGGVAAPPSRAFTTRIAVASRDARFVAGRSDGLTCPSRESGDARSTRSKIGCSVIDTKGLIILCPLSLLLSRDEYVPVHEWADQQVRKLMRRKDGLVFYPAHNLTTASSNRAPGTTRSRHRFVSKEIYFAVSKIRGFSSLRDGFERECPEVFR
jgi:hypothetical protein